MPGVGVCGGDGVGNAFRAVVDGEEQGIRNRATIFIFMTKSINPTFSVGGVVPCEMVFAYNSFTCVNVTEE